MAMWIDYGMFGFCINSNIKSKYQCSYRIAVRLTDLLSKKQRSDNLMAMWIDYSMFWFCLKYGYNHRVNMTLVESRYRKTITILWLKKYIFCPHLYGLFISEHSWMALLSLILCNWNWIWYQLVLDSYTDKTVQSYPSIFIGRWPL